MNILRSATILAATLATSVAAPCFVPSAFATIGNGSFEYPYVSPGTYHDHAVGTSFGKWQVVGPPGAVVSVLSGTFVQGQYVFNTNWGTRYLDLTGSGSNQAEGVQQRIRTAPGTSETIKFWVGNVSGNGFGTSSTVKVYINGSSSPWCTVTNSNPGTLINWVQSNLINCPPFTASTWTTTIKFMNADPSGDNSNMLDNISVTP